MCKWAAKWKWVHFKWKLTMPFFGSQLWIIFTFIISVHSIGFASITKTNIISWNSETKIRIWYDNYDKNKLEKVLFVWDVFFFPFILIFVFFSSPGRGSFLLFQNIINKQLYANEHENDVVSFIWITRWRRQKKPTRIVGKEHLVAENFCFFHFHKITNHCFGSDCHSKIASENQEKTNQNYNKKRNDGRLS